jgi:quaternary ammonium compound-resistance protein SugE
MAWMYLFIGGILEIVWTIGLKQMGNHRNLWWTVIFYVSIISSFGFLQKALETLPIGTAYSIYTSIGVIGTAIVGMVFFKEPFGLLRIFFILLIIGGAFGLKITSTNY